MKQVYSDYTNKLSTVDKSKFENGIYEKIFNKIDDINTKLTKENSIEGRKVLNNLKKELSSLRDLSPEGIQNYIETLGKQSRTSGGQAPNLNQIERANMGGEIRKILDDSIEKLDGQGYQDLRNIYKSHKTIESQLLQSAKSELNKTPGWTDRLANLGMTAEGINFLVTHDPATLAVAIGIKGSTKYMKWVRSPQRALNNVFKTLEKNQSSSKSPLIPSQINQSANIVPKNTIIPTKLPQPTKKASVKVILPKKKK